MSMASRFIMYTVDKIPFMCGISINIQLDYQGICGYIVNVHIDVSKSTNALCGNIDAVPNNCIRCLGSDAFITKNYNDVTCIMMDICGSTEYVRRNTDENAAMLMRTIFDISRKHIVEMYPFVYIHELIGDCVFIIVDAPYMVRNQSNVAIDISRKIQKDVDNFLQIGNSETNMYLRVGIACGPVAAGIIDGRTFRLFGLTVHIAQRLESVCPEGKITFNQKFKDKHNIEDCVQHCKILKGLGNVTYYTL
jgi:class 3 adenylate cyclase